MEWEFMAERSSESTNTHTHILNAKYVEIISTLPRALGKNETLHKEYDRHYLPSYAIITSLPDCILSWDRHLHRLNVVAEWSAVLLDIQEAPGSNLVEESGNPNWGFSVFVNPSSHVTLWKALRRAMTASFHTLLVHHSSTILTNF